MRRAPVTSSGSGRERRDVSVVPHQIASAQVPRALRLEDATECDGAPVGDGRAWMRVCRGTRARRATTCPRLLAWLLVQDELGPPPTNPDDWSDEQWIDWLVATDAIAADQSAPATRAGRITHSTGGQVLGATMIGLARALYGPEEEKPAVVAERGEPDDDGPLSVHLDFARPDQSYVRLTDEADRPDR